MQLAGTIAFNTGLPFLMYLTNRIDDDNTGCYDSCYLWLAIYFMIFEFPSILVFGVPFLAMGLYSLIGRSIGMRGSIVKFFIVYYARYLGLAYHVLSSIFVIRYPLYEGWDYIYPFVHVIASVLLEIRYTALGHEALKYVDPDWTERKNMIYPFAI